MPGWHPLDERRRRTALGALLALGLIAAACGGGSGKRPTAGATTTSTGPEPTASTVANEGAAPTTSTTSAVTATTAGGGVTGAASGARTATTAARKASAGIPAATTKRVTAGIVNVTAAPPTTPSQPVQPGGTLTELLISDPPGFDPVVMGVSVVDTAAMGVFDMLVYTDSSDGSIKPEIAESVTSTDGVVWDLKVRPGVKFSDGTAFDAAAVKFNWLRHQDPANVSVQATAANQIKTMDVVDPLTLRLTLVNKNYQFPRTVARLSMIGSPTAFQQKGSKFINDPVGAGPFTLKEWARGDHITLVRNPNYWNAPRPYVDQVILRPISDESQRINSFNVGEGNIIYSTTPETGDQLKKAGAGGTPLVQNGGTLLYFNVTKPPFNDLRLRRAVVLAFDRVQYTKVLRNNIIDSTDSIFRHESPFFDPNLVQPPADAATAQQLFDQVAADNGGPVSVTLSSFSSSNYAVQSQYIQGVLNQFRNIKVTIDLAASAVHIARVMARNYQFTIYANPFDDPDPMFADIYKCNANPSATGFCDPKFDADVADSRVTSDPNQRVADFKDAQRSLYAGLPVDYYERRYIYVLPKANVQDFVITSDALPLWDRAWIKTH